MSRYYRDLHDRELLNQAELLLAELHRRRLLDIRVPQQTGIGETEFIRCPVHSVVKNGTVLSIVADRTFEPTAQIWEAEQIGKASGAE
jgi:hypothetical protein